MADHQFDKTDLLAYATGSCTDIKRVLIEKHLLTCDHCRAYYAGLEAERIAFLKDNPFQSTISLPAVAEKREKPFIGRPYYALAASLVLFVAAFYLYMASSRPAEFRIKGTVGLKTFVQNYQGGIEKRQNGMYHPGEKIQFLYSCDAANRFVLLGIDTTGSITLYYPEKGDSSVTLESGQDIPLPNSIALDDYTGRELFIGLFSKKPLFVPDVRNAVEKAFTGGRSIDSLPVKVRDAVVASYLLTVLPGGEK